MPTHGNASDLSDWTPKKKFKQENKQIPGETIDYLLRERHSNGLEDAVRVLGRTQFIHKRRFAAWLENGCKRSRNARPVLQSDGQARKREGLKRTGHTASTKRGAIAKK